MLGLGIWGVFVLLTKAKGIGHSVLTFAPLGAVANSISIP